MPRSDGHREVLVAGLPKQPVASSVDHVATRLEALEQLGGLSKRADLDVEQVGRVDVGCLCDAFVSAHAAGLSDGGPTTDAGQHDLTDLPQTDSGQIPASLAAALIRRLFAAGLHLASLQSLLGESALSGKAATALEELDSLIRDIRTAALEQS